MKKPTKPRSARNDAEGHDVVDAEYEPPDTNWSVTDDSVGDDGEPKPYEADLGYDPRRAALVPVGGVGGSLAAAVAAERVGGDPRSREQRIFDAWLRSRKPTTVRAYLWTLDNFAKRIGARSRSQAIAQLCEDHGRANEWMVHLVDDLVNEGKKPATVNRYVTALKSMVKIANRIGLVEWTLAVSSPPVITYRDTAGPPKEVVDALLTRADARVEAAGGGLALATALRDRALLWLMSTGGFRRGELASLQTKHVDKKGVWILGKARAERELFSLPEITMRVLREWIVGRRTMLAAKPSKRPPTDAVFLALDRRAYGQALTENGIYYVTTEMESAIEALAGVRWSPHKFRHFAVSDVADRLGLEVATAFGRHRNPSTTLKYIDNLRQKAARGAEAIEQGIRDRLGRKDDAR
jgi:integrase/recombinase XerC